MGYAFYDFNDGKGPRGYGVDDVCNLDGCDAKIDRGLSYLCYSCTGYFCPKHLTVGGGAGFDCFAGQSKQACEACADEYDNEAVK